MARGKRQREEVVVSGSSTMFNDELKNIKGFKEGEELGVAYIEVGCGCTSRKYGDLVGILRVYATGQFVIRCQCWERCEEEEGRMTPEEFEKHGRKEGPRDWKKNIWIHLDYEKVPLKKTQLLQYYKQSSNVANCNSSSKYVFHRDEFLVCYVCGNHRRCRLRTDDEIRIFHDVALKESWKCGEEPFDKITCNDLGERGSSMVYRGCPRPTSCPGCRKCVCLGCVRCRFMDCDCRACVDYMQNGAP